jgi:hypothetical protein
MEMAVARLGEVESQIKSGDFSNAGEVIALKSILLILFKEYYGSAGHYYRELRERLSALLQLMLEQDLCSPSALLDQLPPNRDPLTGRQLRGSENSAP